jgi:hypothetical protein
MARRQRQNRENSRVWPELQTDDITNLGIIVDTLRVVTDFVQALVTGRWSDFAREIVDLFFGSFMEGVFGVDGRPKVGPGSATAAYIHYFAQSPNPALKLYSYRIAQFMAQGHPISVSAGGGLALKRAIDAELFKNLARQGYSNVAGLLDVNCEQFPCFPQPGKVVQIGWKNPDSPFCLIPVPGQLCKTAISEVQGGGLPLSSVEKPPPPPVCQPGYHLVGGVCVPTIPSAPCAGAAYALYQALILVPEAAELAREILGLILELDFIALIAVVHREEKLFIRIGGAAFLAATNLLACLVIILPHKKPPPVDPPVPLEFQPAAARNLATFAMNFAIPGLVPVPAAGLAVLACGECAAEQEEYL